MRCKCMTHDHEKCHELTGQYHCKECGKCTDYHPCKDCFHELHEKEMKAERAYKNNYNKRRLKKEGEMK